LLERANYGDVRGVEVLADTPEAKLVLGIITPRP
jgi:hypothetical protein